MPICQDTGMVFVYITIGQEVHIDGDLKAAINEGVRQGYQEGYLRKSVVSDPLFDRGNTKDNTPAIIYFDLSTNALKTSPGRSQAASIHNFFTV